MRRRVLPLAALLIAACGDATGPPTTLDGRYVTTEPLPLVHDMGGVVDILDSAFIDFAAHDFTLVWVERLVRGNDTIPSRRVFGGTYDIDRDALTLLFAGGNTLAGRVDGGVVFVPMRPYGGPVRDWRFVKH